MKLYLMTLSHEDNTSHLTLLIVNAIGRFNGVTITRPSVIGDNTVVLDYHAWDPMPSYVRNIVAQGVMTYDEFESAVRSVSRIGDVSMTITEVTGEMRAWFMTRGLHHFVSRSLSRMTDTLLNDNNSRAKLRNIINMMDARYAHLVDGDPYYQPIAAYKDTLQHPGGYSRRKDFCKRMGQHIANSIKENNDAFSQHFMWEYQCLDDIHNLVASAAKAVFDSHGIALEIEEQHCDHWDYPSETSEVHIGRGRYRSYCHRCVEDNDIVIETYDTGILMLREEAYWSERHEEYYEHEPEDESYNDDDYHSESEDTGLLSYNANVLDILNKDESFTSSPFGDFHMGIEFELVTSGSISEAVDDLRDQLGEDYVICKADGSLPIGGIEIVTTPRKLADHIHRFSEWNIHSNYTAWKTNRCGMHVHMDSRAFTRMTLGKFIVFINADCNADFIRKIAGRHPLRDEQARSYCAAEGQSVIANPSKALKGKNPSRYFMVNTTCLRGHEADRLGVRHVGERGFNTIELRIFRASLKQERLLAQIEFAHAAVMFCRVASMRDLNGVMFLKWLKSTDNRYPHLSDWFGIRRRVGAKNSAPAETKCTDTV